jgi:hypothetical protein
MKAPWAYKFSLMVVALCFVGAFGFGLGIPLTHAAEWLRTGTSSNYETTRQFFGGMGWTLPHTSWVGVQRIVDAIFDLPVAATGFSLFGLVGWYFANMAEQQEDSDQKAYQDKLGKKSN